MNNTAFQAFEVDRSYMRGDRTSEVLSKTTLTVTDNDDTLDKSVRRDDDRQQELEFEGMGNVRNYRFRFVDKVQVEDGSSEYETYVVSVRIQGEGRKHFLVSNNPDFDPSVGDQVSSMDRERFTEAKYDDVLSAMCFTAGTRLETPSGNRAVEEMRVGDMVLTADSGAQPIRWIGLNRLSVSDLSAAPNLAPIKIQPGAFGNVRPLILSPQHRLLTGPAAPATLDLPSDQFVSARHAARFLNAGSMCLPEMGVTYIHILLNRHEVLFAEGAATESLLIGPQSWGSMETAARREVMKLFPNLMLNPRMNPARNTLTASDIRSHLGRKNQNLPDEWIQMVRAHNLQASTQHQVKEYQILN